MSITDKTRKILWGRSGNMCALCRRALVEPATPHDSEAVVGDEAHILGEKPGAARHDTSITEAERSGYNNLMLVCKVHHKLIDDQPNTYPAATLREIKKRHERWVKETLAESTPNLVRMTRLTSGREITTLLFNSQAHVLDHSNSNASEEQAEKFDAFFDTITEWSDIIHELSRSEQAPASKAFHEFLGEFQAAGFWVMGGQGKDLSYGVPLRTIVLKIIPAPILLPDIGGPPQP